MMRGKVLCILKGGKCACIHQCYSEPRKFHDGQVSVSHFCKTPFLGGMETNIFFFYNLYLRKCFSIYVCGL